MLSPILSSISRHKGNLLAIALGQGLTIVAVAVGTRVLTESASAATFGEAKLVVGLVLLPMALLLRPFSQFSMREHHDARESKSSSRFLRFARVTQSRLAALTAVAFVSGLLVYRFFNGSPAVATCVAGGVMLVGEALVTLERGMLVTTNRQLAASVLSFLHQGAMPFLAAAALVLVADDAATFVSSQALALCLLAIVCWATSRTGTDDSLPPANRPAEIAKWTGEAKRFVIPMLGMGIFGWMLNVGDRYLLAYWVAMDDVGRYSAVYGLIATPMAAVCMMTSRFLLPLVYDSAARDDAGRRRSMRLRMVATGVVIAVAAFVFIWLFGGLLASLLLAEEYRRGAAELMIWLVAGNGFMVVAAAYEVEAMARKTTAVLTIAPAVGAIANVLVNLALIPKMGTMGAAIATCAGFGVYMLVLIGLLERRRRE